MTVQSAWYNNKDNKPVITYAATFTNILSQQHNTILCFINSIIHNFSQHNCKLPEDGVLTPKHVGVILM